MRYAFQIVLVLLFISTGCLGNGNPPATPSLTTTSHETPDADSDAATTTEHTSSSGPVTPANLASSGAVCDDDLWVGLWELNNEDVWDADVVRVGYYTPPNSSFLLVAYVDGDAAGVTQIQNRYVSGEHVDGDKITLDSPLSGKHWVQVVAFSDENTNGRFDQGVDTPCLVDGELVGTDVYLVDFSKL
ncbi:hypothetical protein SAMN04487950_1956 [Halogranum rubrum]|uniref:Uncharacterized protein n=1 Tax=Halogranum rubrum TaxID=553466 RepID=A0A1I4E8P7_9EURY|nr:hypothetical protein [Halogranum rubrum]SFL01549.1 hypothetical protein SAMN04487950_1956 [Halogranum rubrum]